MSLFRKSAYLISWPPTTFPLQHDDILPVVYLSREYTFTLCTRFCTSLMRDSGDTGLGAGPTLPTASQAGARAATRQVRSLSPETTRLNFRLGSQLVILD